eukprot:COSAG01_NODE_7787_length_3057_cov_5.243746_1_plen_231_part_00
MPPDKGWKAGVPYVNPCDPDAIVYKKKDLEKYRDNHDRVFRADGTPREGMLTRAEYIADRKTHPRLFEHKNYGITWEDLKAIKQCCKCDKLCVARGGRTLEEEFAAGQQRYRRTGEARDLHLPVPYLCPRCEEPPTNGEHGLPVKDTSSAAEQHPVAAATEGTSSTAAKDTSAKLPRSPLGPPPGRGRSILETSSFSVKVTSLVPEGISPCLLQTSNGHHSLDMPRIFHD